MIRSTTPADTDAILALAVETGLAPPGGEGEIRAVLAAHFAGTLGDGHTWLTDDENGPAGVAYVAPERMTDGTWNLLMIAVRPEFQRCGRGAALVRQVESAAFAGGGRLLLVETSGLPEFEQARGFYRRCGFSEAARIHDFYRLGDDKVIFRKVLSGSS